MLHFVHVVSTYDALIKTPKGGEGNTHQTLDFVSQHCVSRGMVEKTEYGVRSMESLCKVCF